ncbi:hypothetical protein DXG01_014615 [Tephrocybe rancida]|nr:hypothetical protein DXG01_014615 [Tephrocybe rancida]
MDPFPLNRTPLPKLQLLVLFLVQFAEPLTSSVVLPFVNQFVRDTGVTGGDERKTGYYAGLLTLPSAVMKREMRVQSMVGPEPTAPLLRDDTPSYGSTGASQTDQTKTNIEAPVPFRGLLIPQVLVPLLVYITLAFIDMNTQVLLPLMYSTSISVGGLGFDAYRIGIVLSVFGFVNAFVQLFLLGKLVRLFGPRNLLALAQVSYATTIGLYPALTFLVRRAGRVNGKVWAVVVAQLVSRLATGMGWGE